VAWWYEPDEFTFTARAGTPVREVAAVLEARGQHLPFDPLLGEAGATLGGTVASGLSGPGRFRFGVRDFILGAVCGWRRPVAAHGGKVIKNAAWIPKFMVGSLGRFGVLAEITFKVFPRRKSSLTVCREMENLPDAIRMLVEAAGSRWELRALDLLPGTTTVVAVRGPASALAPMAARSSVAARARLSFPRPTRFGTGCRGFAGRIRMAACSRCL
jgi:glycolate oxidase FAD binding subunit